MGWVILIAFLIWALRPSTELEIKTQNYKRYWEHRNWHEANPHIKMRRHYYRGCKVCEGKL